MATSLASMAHRGVGSLEGVGDKRREALHVLGVDTLADLLTFYPRRWVDRTNEARVATWCRARRRWCWSRCGP